MMMMAMLGRFCHGLVFFTLAVTVVFLHRRSHRVALSRHLLGLGGFAAFEALRTWFVLFATTIPSVASVSPVVSPALHGLAYTLLMGFGLQAVMSEERYQTRARLVVAGLCSLWLVPYAAAAAAARPDWEVLSGAEAALRYLLALPGGILASVALGRQGHRSRGPMMGRRIRLYLRISAAAVAIFGVLSVVTTQRQVRAAADLVPWMWVIVGVAMTFGLVRALTTIEHEIEQWVEGVERLQTLVADRERIGRELHDGIIQSIYAAGLLLEGIVPVIPRDPERAQAQLGRVMDSLNATIRDIRRYIFDLRSDMVDEDLPEGIEHLLRDFRVNTLLETEFTFAGEVQTINSVNRRRHIFQIVREALTNTAKHARARWVSVQLEYNEESLELMISDDGVGMEELLVGKGYGLRNIRERARLLGGTLRIESAPGEGVTYHLTVPYV